jgi:hypothetical protein
MKLHLLMLLAIGSSSTIAMAAPQLTVRNQTTYPAQISITQDGGFNHSFSLPGGGDLTYQPAPEIYTANAAIQLGNFIINSPQVDFTGNKRVTARVFCRQGFADFELLVADALGFDQIELENQTQTQVQFTVAQGAGPLAFQKMTDPQTVTPLSTRRRYTLGAVVDNFSIPSLDVTVPALVDLVPGINAECAFQLESVPIAWPQAVGMGPSANKRTFVRVLGEAAIEMCRDQ